MRLVASCRGRVKRGLVLFALGASTLLAACGSPASSASTAAPAGAEPASAPTPSVTVTPTSTVVATAAPTVAPAPTPTIVTVSGVITDVATGGPVSGLAVVFYDGSRFCATNGVGVAPDYVSQTKSDGSYSIKLIAGTYFVAVNGTRANNDYQGVFRPTCPSTTKIDRDLTINWTVTHK